MTGKKTTNKRKIGIPKNTQDKIEIWKEFAEDIGIDEFFKLMNELVEEGDEKVIQKIKDRSKNTKLSSKKVTKILNLSKTTICNIKNNKHKIIRDDSKRKLLINRIHDIYIGHNSNIDKKCISGIMLKRFKYKISDRQVGRIMNKFGLFCDMRITKNIK